MHIEIHDSDSAAQPYFWRIMADNNRELAKSETYHNKSDVTQTVQTFKAYAAHPTRIVFEVFRSRSATQHWTWHARSGSHILVASSETYYNLVDAQNISNWVKNNAASAQVIDKTVAGSRR